MLSRFSKLFCNLPKANKSAFTPVFFLVFSTLKRFQFAYNFATTEEIKSVMGHKVFFLFFSHFLQLNSLPHSKTLPMVDMLASFSPVLPSKKDLPLSLKMLEILRKSTIKYLIAFFLLIFSVRSFQKFCLQHCFQEN